MTRPLSESARQCLAVLAMALSVAAASADCAAGTGGSTGAGPAPGSNVFRPSLPPAARAPGPAQSGAKRPAPPQPPQPAQRPAAEQPPAKPAVPAAEQAKASPPPPENFEALPANQIIALMGTKVRGPKEEDMGLVVDVIVDRTGNPRALVIDFGGFLGVGSRKIAIDWRLVHFRPENRDAPVQLLLSHDQVQAAPVFDPSIEPLRIVGPPPAPPNSPNAKQ